MFEIAYFAVDISNLVSRVLDISLPVLTILYLYIIFYIYKYYIESKKINISLEDGLEIRVQRGNVDNGLEQLTLDHFANLEESHSEREGDNE